MAVPYSKEEIIKLALEIIPEEEVTGTDELCLYLPCGKTWFYTNGLNESNEIKEAIYLQKVKVKKKLRRNWRNSDNATLQIAEFKLLSTDEELTRLNTQKVNADIAVTGKGKVIMELPTDDAPSS